MKIGFIGTGNMGGALARAAAKTGAEILLFDRDKKKAADLAAELKGAAISQELLLSSADLIFLGVKPQVLPAVFADLKPLLKTAKPKAWVSMAAGVPIQKIRDGLNGAPVIRIMPNTPVGVGKGMVLYTCSENVAKKAKDVFLKTMNRAGRLLRGFRLRARVCLPVRRSACRRRRRLRPLPCAGAAACRTDAFRHCGTPSAGERRACRVEGRCLQSGRYDDRGSSRIGGERFPRRSDGRGDCCL